jgi:hypothetical protein
MKKVILLLVILLVSSISASALTYTIDNCVKDQNTETWYIWRTVFSEGSNVGSPYVMNNMLYERLYVNYELNYPPPELATTTTAVLENGGPQLCVPGTPCRDCTDVMKIVKYLIFLPYGVTVTVTADPSITGGTQVFQCGETAGCAYFPIEIMWDEAVPYAVVDLVFDGTSSGSSNWAPVIINPQDPQGSFIRDILDLDLTEFEGPEFTLFGVLFAAAIILVVATYKRKKK